MTTLEDEVPAFRNTQDIHLTAALMVTYARWWVGSPDAQIDKLKTLRANTKPDIGLCGMTADNRAMLRHFKDRALAQRLLHCPGDVCDDYLNIKRPKKHDHWLMAEAAMAALLLSTAVRPKNGATARIGVNLFERAGKMIYQAPAEEVKNNVAIEFVLPDYAARIIRNYISRARPHLLAGDSDYLFPAAGGGHISIGYFGQKVGKFIERQIGVRVTGHRFRHVCGFLYLQDNPNGYEVVRLLLGHKSLLTTIRYYCGAEAEEAQQRFDEFMARRRNEINLGGRPSPGAKPKGGRRG